VHFAQLVRVHKARVVREQAVLRKQLRERGSDIASGNRSSVKQVGTAQVGAGLAVAAFPVWQVVRVGTDEFHRRPGSSAAFERATGSFVPVAGETHGPGYEHFWHKLLRGNAHDSVRRMKNSARIEKSSARNVHHQPLDISGLIRGGRAGLRDRNCVRGCAPVAV